MAPDSLLLAHEVHAPHHEATVVLLHSLALDRRVWRSFIGPLSESMAVVAVDLRGHGASPGSAGFTIEQMADDVALTLSELGRERAVVVGLSMGGCVAQAFAVRHPERLTALGLIDTTAWYGPDAEQAWRQRAEKARQDGMRSLSRFQLTRWFGDDFRSRNDALCQELLDIFAANDLGSYVSACAALGAVDLRDRIVSVNVPTVVIVGAEDAATPPSDAADLQARIRGSVLHVVPQTRHLTPVERPEEVLALLGPILAPRWAGQRL